MEIRFKAGTPKETVLKALKNIARSRHYDEIQTYEFVGGLLQEFEYEAGWQGEEGRERPCYRIAEDCHDYV